MEWYIIIGLSILLLLVLIAKKPNLALKMFVENIMAVLKKNEAFLVQGVYNALPKELKASIGSQHVSILVAYVIMIIGKLLKENKL